MKVLALLFSLMTLTACASTATSKNTPSTSAPLASKGLSARTLAAGECGLFVWQTAQGQPFILFTKAADKHAVWQDGTIETPLTTVAQTGSSAQGQYPVQEFKTSTQTFKLHLKTPERFEGGTRYRAGTLTISSKDEWDRVIPVVGLAACQTPG